MSDRNRLLVSVLQSILKYFLTCVFCYFKHFLCTTAASHFHNCNLSEKSLFSVGYRLLQSRERKGKQNTLGLSMCDDLRLATFTCQSSFPVQIQQGSQSHTQRTTIFHIPFGSSKTANTKCHSSFHFSCKLLWSHKRQMCVPVSVYVMHQN